jgi:hypothetical protein
LAGQGRGRGSSRKPRAPRATGQALIRPDEEIGIDDSKPGRRGREYQQGGGRGTSTRGRGRGRGRGARSSGSEAVMHLNLPRLPAQPEEQDLDRPMPMHPTTPLYSSTPTFLSNREHDLFKDHGGTGRGEGWTSLRGIVGDIFT